MPEIMEFPLVSLYCAGHARDRIPGTTKLIHKLSARAPESINSLSFSRSAGTEVY